MREKGNPMRSQTHRVNLNRREGGGIIDAYLAESCSRNLCTAHGAGGTVCWLYTLPVPGCSSREVVRIHSNPKQLLGLGRWCCGVELGKSYFEISGYCERGGALIPPILVPSRGFSLIINRRETGTGRKHEARNSPTH